jgi:hypothetical protein
MRTRRGLAVGAALLFGATACGRTATRELTSAGDAGATDSRPFDMGHRDLGLQDLGRRDLGSPDRGVGDLGGEDVGSPDAGRPICDLGELAIGFDATPSGARFEGPARVLAVDPLRLRFVGRREVGVTFEEGMPRPPVEVGEQYFVLVEPASFEGGGYFAIQGGPREPAVSYAAWRLTSLPEGGLAYEPAACGADPLRCGDIRRLDLVLDGPGGSRRLRPGERGRIADYVFTNGRSYTYVGPSCPGVPPRLHEGMVVLRGAP